MSPADLCRGNARPGASAPAEGQAGNVIGIDDFAFRRGRRYGTIVVDHESGGVIDLLADRMSATLEVWLAETLFPWYEQIGREQDGRKLLGRPSAWDASLAWISSFCKRMSDCRPPFAGLLLVWYDQ